MWLWKRHKRLPLSTAIGSCIILERSLILKEINFRYLNFRSFLNLIKRGILTNKNVSNPCTWLYMFSSFILGGTPSVAALQLQLKRLRMKDKRSRSTVTILNIDLERKSGSGFHRMVSNLNVNLYMCLGISYYIHVLYQLLKIIQWFFCI